MNFTPYDTIAFRTYQMNRPNLIDPNTLPAKGDKNSIQLNQFLDDIVLDACQYTYNKKMEIINNGIKTHEAYINITKHLCVCVSCEYINDSGNIRYTPAKMYLTDILFEKKDDEHYYIREIMSYRINNGNVPSMKFSGTGATVGLWNGDKNSYPDKLPVIGFGENKLFIPQRSAFLEGPHVNLYKQDFNFNCYPNPISIGHPENDFDPNGENNSNNIKKLIQLHEIN